MLLFQIKANYGHSTGCLNEYLLNTILHMKHCQYFSKGSDALESGYWGCKSLTFLRVLKLSTPQRASGILSLVCLGNRGIDNMVMDICVFKTKL